jgi:hypothetical protein
MPRTTFSLLLVGSVAITTVAGAHNSVAEILIGYAGPLTGEMALASEGMQNGVELAIAELNPVGGVLGQKVTLELVDRGTKARGRQSGRCDRAPVLGYGNPRIPGLRGSSDSLHRPGLQPFAHRQGPSSDVPNGPAERCQREVYRPVHGPATRGQADRHNPRHARIR